MYQGKFLPENRAKHVAAMTEKRNAPAPVQEEAYPVNPQPYQEPVQEQPIYQEELQETEMPAAPQKAPKQKKKKRIRVGTVIFYLLYLMLIGAAAYGIHYGLGLLNDWLVTYEASQPDTVSKQIFDELFAQPDWGKIYDMAGLEVTETEFEGKEAYVTYMEQLVGDQELTYTKTSAGLTGGEKYIVRAGDEKVATFTMQNPVTDEMEIPQWSLSGVEAGFFTRDEDVTILTQPGHTVKLNGVTLDEDYIIKTTTSTVDSYLPEGIHGPRTATLYAKGFLVAPQVLVLDEDGNEVELHYDADTNTYAETIVDESTTAEISDEEYQALLNATKAYSRAMIGDDLYEWQKHFVKNSELYKQIRELVGGNSFFKGWTRYEFEPETITEYHRYSDDLFSARIQMKLNTYRKDGTVKPFEVDTTIFMQKDSKGKWLVIQLVNAQIHGTLTHVRMTWTDEDGQILASEMVDATTDFLNPPKVVVPEGKTFVGWFIETTDAEGNKTLKLTFTPLENGTVALPTEYVLEPMVLIARFENKGE